MEGYPKVKYHIRGGGTVLVTDPVQEKALGPDWTDHRPPQEVLQPIAVAGEPKKRGRPRRVMNEGT